MPSSKYQLLRALNACRLELDYQNIQHGTITNIIHRYITHEGSHWVWIATGDTYTAPAIEGFIRPAVMPRPHSTSQRDVELPGVPILRLLLNEHNPLLKFIEHSQDNPSRSILGSHNNPKSKTRSVIIDVRKYLFCNTVHLAAPFHIPYSNLCQAMYCVHPEHRLQHATIQQRKRFA